MGGLLLYFGDVKEHFYFRRVLPLFHLKWWYNNLVLTLTDWAQLIIVVLSIFGIVAGGIRFLVKHYFHEMKAELKPNSGSSLKDQVTRLELRANEADQMRRDMDKKLDKMYSILIDYISKSSK